MDIPMVYFIISVLISNRICKEILGFYHPEEIAFNCFNCYRNSSMSKEWHFSIKESWLVRVFTAVLEHKVIWVLQVKVRFKEDDYLYQLDHATGDLKSGAGNEVCKQSL